MPVVALAGIIELVIARVRSRSCAKLRDAGELAAAEYERLKARALVEI